MIGQILLIQAITLASLYNVSAGHGLPPVLDISRLESLESGCNASLSTLRDGLNSRQLWAQQMVDASVKSPVGLLSSTLTQFGDFDECLGVDGPLSPQYCLVQISPGTTNKQQINTNTWSEFRWGVCVPAACSPPELQEVVQRFMNQTVAQGDNIGVSVIPPFCTTPLTRNLPWTTLDSVFCVLMAMLVAIVSISTVLDYRNNPENIEGGHPGSLLECMSARRGLLSLWRVDYPVSQLNLQPLHGVHALAFFFIVFGHRFGFHMIFMHTTNFKAVRKLFTGSTISMWTGHMDLFVDVFFFTSSFLLGVLYTAKLQKQSVNPLLVYLQRVVRLVPVYAVMIFFVASVLHHLGDGPLWNLFILGEQEKCKNYWWTNLFFIHNYVHKEDMCLIHSWYISCEFQLFVVGTLLVLALHKCPKLGTWLCALFFVASTLAAFLGTYLYHRPAFMMFLNDFWNDPTHHDEFTSVYSQGHYRGTSYIVGLLAGVYVFRRRLRPLSKTSTQVLQVCGVLCIVTVYWSGGIFYQLPYNRLLSALYAASFHSVFTFGLSCIFVAWTLGQPTVVSRLFSWRGFVPLSKLSFCVYLLHPIPLFLWLGSARTPVSMSVLELASWTVADVAFALIISFFVYLFVETPPRYLVKYFITDTLASERDLPKTTQFSELEDNPVTNLFKNSLS